MPLDPASILDGLPDPALLLEASGTIVHGNRQLRQALRLDRADIDGRSVFDLLVDSSRENFAAFLRRCCGTTEPSLGTIIFATNDALLEYRCETARLRRTDGRPGPVMLRCRGEGTAASPFSLLNEQIRNLTREIAARRRAEAALRESEEQLRLATEAAEIGLWDVDPIADALFWPPRVKAMFGISPDMPVSMADFYAGLHPDERERVSACYAAAADPEKRALYDVEYRTVGKEDGIIRWVAAKGRGVFDDNNRCVRVIGVAIDITARRFAAQRLEKSEAALRELNQTLEQRVAQAVAEKMKAEEALHQAQKLEALGQLTGGVAHDFNNLLTVIIGNLDALGDSIRTGKARRHIDAAIRAAQRGATLTQQLLAYARRQHLSVGAVDLNHTIRCLDDLLRRTLGGLVEIEMRLDQDLWHAFIDPTQFEMAILNLAINARDAMPFGGLLQIETGNVRAGDSAFPAELAPGDYVRLRISDTGEGMTPEVLANAMDPFFTTKDVGKGSGLGLSQVYGVVRQCGGAIKLESVTGRGTTVLIWLPRSTLAPAPEATRETAVWTSVPARRGTVLVVDDDADVRQIAAEILGKHGFHIEQAGSGEDALRILETGIPVDLVIVDYAMPRMSGVKFAQIAREMRPHLTVIYITGYAEPASVLQDYPGATIVQKPYKAADLLRAVEAELGKQVRSGGSATVISIRSGSGCHSG